MTSKILMPKGLCEIEAVKHVARRYGTTPEKVLTHYLVQAGMIMKENVEPDGEYLLTANELALLADLGARPSVVELT